MFPIGAGGALGASKLASSSQARQAHPLALHVPPLQGCLKANRRFSILSVRWLLSSLDHSGALLCFWLDRFVNFESVLSRRLEGEPTRNLNNFHWLHFACIHVRNLDLGQRHLRRSEGRKSSFHGGLGDAHEFSELGFVEVGALLVSQGGALRSFVHFGDGPLPGRLPLPFALSLVPGVAGIGGMAVPVVCIYQVGGGAIHLERN